MYTNIYVYVYLCKVKERERERERERDIYIYMCMLFPAQSLPFWLFFFFSFRCRSLRRYGMLQWIAWNFSFWVARMQLTVRVNPHVSGDHAPWNKCLSVGVTFDCWQSSGAWWTWRSTGAELFVSIVHITARHCHTYRWPRGLLCAPTCLHRGTNTHFGPIWFELGGYASQLEWMSLWTSAP